MKLYLASFLQKENFGPGRLISITDSKSKPHNLEVKNIFLPFTPSRELVESYNKTKDGEKFESLYKEQLENVVEKLTQNKNLTPKELLPFEDGDTLGSWERKEFTNYRKILASFLERLGYEVVSN